MIFFTQRKRLAKKYEEWISKNNALDCPFNVISFLSLMGYLNEEKIDEEVGIGFISKDEEN